jgi:hypothetical protein
LIKIELTAEEAQVLTNMIDVAVKAAGLQAAEAGVHFVKKIKEAQEAAKAPAPPAEEPAP